MRPWILVSACLLLGCDTKPDHNQETPPPPPVKWAQLTAHAANGVSEVYGAAGLWNLLAARALSLKVNPHETKWDQPIRALILHECGGDQMRPHKREVIDRSSIDDLYPPERIEEGVTVGCGIIVRSDGSTIRGAGVDWDR